MRTGKTQTFCGDEASADDTIVSIKDRDYTGIKVDARGYRNRLNCLLLRSCCGAAVLNR